jgi:hypothetical protein
MAWGQMTLRAKLLGSDRRGVLRELIEAAAHGGNVHPRRLPDVDPGRLLEVGHEDGVGRPFRNEGSA